MNRSALRSVLMVGVFCCFAMASRAESPNLLPIPERLVVLTFDDGNASDLTTVAPILKRHGFGATFYVTSGWVGRPGRLTWKQVKQLQKMGFEIGNHSSSHPNMLHITELQVREQIAAFDRACAEHGIAKATTFAYPGEHHDRRIVAALGQAGYVAARRGVSPEFPLLDKGGPGMAYDPRQEDPFLIPGTYVRGNLSPSDEEFQEAIDKSGNGRVTVLIYHGVPDVHRHCSTRVELFKNDMQFLKSSDCTVIALRDLARFVDFTARPKDIYTAIVARLGVTASGLVCDTSKMPVRFGWKVISTRPQKQAAYRILVASSRQKLVNDNGDRWDSGKVESDVFTDIAYAGNPLEAGRRYWWKVQCWNQPDQAEVDRVKNWISRELVDEMRKSRAGPFSAPARLEVENTQISN